ncbi:MAG: ComEC/Rec2 family competence protein [Cellulomonas sp.]
MHPTRTDLRLVPAAVAAWATGFVVVSLPIAVALAIGCAAAMAALLVAALLVDARSTTPRARGRRRSVPRSRAGVAGQVLLVLVAVAAVSLSAAGQLAAREAGLLAALTDERATVRLVGTVRSEPVRVASPAGWGDQQDRYRVVLGADHVTGRGLTGSAAAQVLVLAGPAWADVAFGARLEATGRLERAEPGDAVLAVLATRGAPRVVQRPGAADRLVRGVRVALRIATDPLAADPRGLVPGIAVGDTSRMPADLSAAMKVTGLTHITAVSGAHFAIIGAAVLALTGLLGLPRRLRIAVVGTSMAGFVLLVHAEPSVLRAAVMGAVGIAGMLVGRPARALSALGAAVVVLVLADPWLARSFGFALSVLATAGIVLLTAPIAHGPGRRLPREVAHAIAVPLAAQLVCAPVIVLLSPALATYAVPANLAAAPALVPATVAGALAALVAPWWATGGAVLARLAGWAAWWIAEVARLGAALPGAQLPWPGGPGGAGLLAAVTIAVGVAVARGSRGP